MKYIITMRDGTEYQDEQNDSFLNQIAHLMAENEYTPVHLSADGSFVVRCSEISTVKVAA